MPKKPRAVLDTNILISGSLSLKGPTTGGSTTGGPAASLIEMWIEGHFELVVSPLILAEYYDVATRDRIKKHFGPTEEQIKKFLKLLAHGSLLVSDLYTVDRIKKDPTDNKFLAAAMEAQADTIVSLDHHLLEIKHFHEIQIVNLKDFLKVLGHRPLS